MENKTPSPVIEISNLSFTYGCHPVLKDVSLTIMPGEAVGITGPNGAGKTTLIKLILGQLQPQSGRVGIFGFAATDNGWRRWLSYVPQRATHFNQGFPATVLEVVLSGRASRRGLFRGYGPEDHAAVTAALENMEIEHLRKVPVSSLSGGQQQRVFIARALAAGPDLLIMDEPTVGLDRSANLKFYSILKRINRDTKLTMILVSHDQEGISGLITRQVCLNLHLCTCNSWEAAPGGLPAVNCAGLLSLRS